MGKKYMVYGKKRSSSKPRQLTKKSSKSIANRKAKTYRKKGFHVIVIE